MLKRARDRRAGGEAGWLDGTRYTTPWAIDALARMQDAIDSKAVVFVDFRGIGGEDTVLVGRAAGSIRIAPRSETYTKAR